MITLKVSTPIPKCSKTQFSHRETAASLNPIGPKGAGLKRASLVILVMDYKDDHFNFNDQITIFAWVKVKKFSKNFQAIVNCYDKNMYRSQWECKLY